MGKLSGKSLNVARFIDPDLGLIDSGILRERLEKVYPKSKRLKGKIIIIGAGESCNGKGFDWRDMDEKGFMP